jgi:DNA-binding MarR family transcriptional regulator
VSTEPPRYAELVELGRAPQRLAEEDCPGADLGLPADPDDVAGLGQITGPGEITGFGEIADPGVVAGLGAIAGPDEVAGLGETERRRALVAQAARFTAAFARWTDGRSYGGLTYTRLRLLEALHCGGPAIMRELGVQLRVSPRNMTAIVDALEDARLVVRRPHPTDRRATLVELSPAGAAEAEQALLPRLDALAGLFEVLSPDEQQQFFAALGRLAQEIDTRQDT